MEEMTSITVAIPCYNEALTIAKVVNDFRAVLPLADILVLDNASSDSTGDIAQINGARVIRENRQGKGYAVQRIFSEVKTDVLVLVDGDDTYFAEDVRHMLRLLSSGSADMVVGSRFRRARRGSFSGAHWLGNIFFRLLLNLCFGTRHSDILSGYRALNRDFYSNTPVLSEGFEVETELTLQALERGYHVREVPVEYRSRPENSHSKIHELRDGSRIVLTIVSLLRDYRPMVFFSGLSFLLVVSGIFFGSTVIVEYIRTGLIHRMPTALLSVTLLLIGINAIISGLILSAVNRRYREMEVFLKRISSKQQ